MTFCAWCSQPLIPEVNTQTPPWHTWPVSNVIKVVGQFFHVANHQDMDSYWFNSYMWLKSKFCLQNVYCPSSHPPSSSNYLVIYLVISLVLWPSSTFRQVISVSLVGLICLKEPNLTFPRLKEQSIMTKHFCMLAKVSMFKQIKHAKELGLRAGRSVAKHSFITDATSKCYCLKVKSLSL